MTMNICPDDNILLHLVLNLKLAETPKQSENNSQNGPTAEKQEKKQDDTKDEDEMEESESEIGSDMSLPLSDTEEGQAKPAGSTWTAGQDAMETTSR